MDINYLEFSFSIANINIDARIDYSNMLNNIKSSSYELHTHTMYEVYFIESGKLLLECMKEQIELKEHDIFVILPNTEHKIIACNENLKRFNFRFIFRDLVDLNQESSYVIYKPLESISNNIFQNISAIHLYFSNVGGKLNSFRIKNSFGTIISYIAEQLLPRNLLDNNLFAERSDALTQRIVIDRFFAENYSKHVTINDLAAELNYSKTHINRLLQKYSNMTFSQNLSAARLNAAKKYLKTTKLSTSEIAYKCGFSSLRGFELFFKKSTNLLPNEFRKTNKKIP